MVSGPSLLHFLKQLFTSILENSVLNILAKFTGKYFFFLLLSQVYIIFCLLLLFHRTTLMIVKCISSSIPHHPSITTSHAASTLHHAAEITDYHEVTSRHHAVKATNYKDCTPCHTLIKGPDSITTALYTITITRFVISTTCHSNTSIP